MASGQPGARSPTPIWSLVEDSLDEAEFLWRRWEQALSSHAHDLEGVSFWIEERLSGSLEGVRVGAEPAFERLLLPALDADDSFRATAAAHVLATETAPRAFQLLVHGMKSTAPERLAIFRRAVELSHSDLLLARLERELAGVSPALGAALMDARTFQGREPTMAVAEALSSGELALQVAAVRALRCGAPQFALNAVVSACRSPDAGVVEAAVESGLMLGVADAWSMCRHLAAARAPAPRARLLLGLLGTERDQTSLYDALTLEDSRHEAMFALGFAGTFVAAEAAVQFMREPTLAQLAAEAFCAITGLDLEAQKLLAPEAEGAPEEPIPFEQEDLDANLVPTPDELLPHPDVEGVLRWWRANAGRFSSKERYLRGRPLDLTRLHGALVAEPMRRRHAIALELGVRTHGRLQLQTRTFSGEQKRQLLSFTEMAGGSGPRSPLVPSFSRL